MAAGQLRRQNLAGQAAARKLLYIPIIHTQADLGSLGKSAAREGQRRLGPRGWQHKVRVVAQTWTAIERIIRGLRLPYQQVRLYQDGLPVCGREEAIVAELARAGSPNHRLLQELISKGATLMGTESWELLQEEYRLARESLAATGRSSAPTLAAAPGGSAAILHQRDRFIATRINDTLKAGETGILFVGRLHSIEPYLDKDIQVSYPWHPAGS